MARKSLKIFNWLVLSFWSANSIAVSELEICTHSLLAFSRNIPAGVLEHRYGGFRVLRGFTTVNTRELLTPRLSHSLLEEYRKVVPQDDSKTQQSYTVSPRDKLKGPVAAFVRAHKELVLAVLNADGRNWKWEISSLLLVSEKLQDGFHDHLNVDERLDPNHRVTRQNAGVSLGFAGTVFRSPNNENDIYLSEPGETSIFNEGTLHQSPDGANLRLYLLHWFSRAP